MFVFAGICSFDGLIYVCGGYDGASCLSSMERFDPLTGIWCSCPAMNTRRRYCRISVVGRTVLYFSVEQFSDNCFQRIAFMPSAVLIQQTIKLPWRDLIRE